ncbi:glycosyltransferase [Tolypothrix sp. PCC 7910]|uniref:glycosyltransferase family 2 protein n=1 Tax=Tolypothrix sp. PCC 7910 TaxID=2099387 RepID=UPI0014279DD1|nr:glycosyltransferase [Tolypothrix sp. PCC 7910]QIR37995.1 glycosyltransferase [Tolypothrix sp. PCC 7910]
MTKISICIPTYNAEKFIRTTIASCLQQTQAPWEILLSDDGSGDRTPAILSEYASSPNVKIISPPQHLGIGEHYRYLSMSASGTHAVFLSCDDALHPDFVQVATRELQKTPNIAMLAFGGYSCNANLQPLSRFGLSYPTRVLEPPNGFIHFIPSCTYILSTCVWNCEFLQQLDPLPTKAGLVTDWYWSLVAGLQCPIRLSRQALGYYRYHDTNSSHSNPERWKNHAIEMINYLAMNHELTENLPSQIKHELQSITISFSEQKKVVAKSPLMLRKVKEMFKSLMVNNFVNHPNFLQIDTFQDRK